MPLSLVRDLDLTGIQDSSLTTSTNGGLGPALAYGIFAIASLDISQSVRGQQVLLLDLLLRQLLLHLLIGIYDITVANHGSSSLSLSLTLALNLSLTLMPLRKLLIEGATSIALLGAALQATCLLGVLRRALVPTGVVVRHLLLEELLHRLLV